MSVARYDLLTARESNGKTYFNKIGVMFPNKNGDGFNIMLEALPLPGPDGCRLIAKVPQDRTGDRPAPRQNTRRPEPEDMGEDMDAPF